MNYFKLDTDDTLSAQYHLDKHVVKMPTEYAQLLCTAHRVLDGELWIDKTANNRSIKRWRLDENEDLLYKATHINHPTAKWVRESKQNYAELYNVFVELCKEYTHRYGKVHMCQTKLEDVLATPPTSIPDVPATPVPQAMPVDVQGPNVVTAYRNYYVKHKAPLGVWTKRSTPEWFIV